MTSPITLALGASLLAVASLSAHADVLRVSAIPDEAPRARVIGEVMGGAWKPQEESRMMPAFAPR